MNRIIVDFNKLTPEILTLLVEKYPDGYGIRDIIKFTNSKGNYIEAVEVRTEDTDYLVKVSDQLVDSMERFDEDIDLSMLEDTSFKGEVDLEEDDDD